MRYSDISTFNSCPYKYKLQKEGWLKREDSEESAQKIFGQAIHKALEEYYSGKSEEESVKAFYAVYSAPLTEKEQFSPAAGEKLFREYLKHYQEMDKDWTILATELLGKVETLTGSHELHIDVVVKHKPTGSIYFKDYKTTDKAFSALYWRKFELSSQLSRYTKFVVDKYGSCAGAIIDALQTGYRKRAYKGEPAGYYQRYERQIFNRTDQMLKDWMESDKNWEEMILWSKEKNCYPKALGSLCGFCEFYQYCSSGCEPSILEALYEKSN